MLSNREDELAGTAAPRRLDQVHRSDKILPMPKEMNVATDTASSIISGKIPLLQIPSPAIQAAQHGHPEAIESYIIAYYYAALTNLFCQISLPPTQQVENNDVVKAIIDASYNDFYRLDSSLGALDPNEIQASPNSHLYQEVRDAWRHWVKNWTMISKRNQETG